MPAQEPRRAREPVGEVAERAAEQQHERAERHPVGLTPRRAQQHDRDDDRADRKHRREVLEPAERAPEFRVTSSCTWLPTISRGTTDQCATAMLFVT